MILPQKQQPSRNPATVLDSRAYTVNIIETKLRGLSLSIASWKLTLLKGWASNFLHPCDRTSGHVFKNLNIIKGTTST